MYARVRACCSHAWARVFEYACVLRRKFICQLYERTSRVQTVLHTQQNTRKHADTYTHKHTHTNTRTSTHTHAQTRTHKLTHAYRQRCTHTKNLHTRTHTHARTHARTHTRTHTHTHIYIYRRLCTFAMPSATPSWGATSSPRALTTRYSTTTVWIATAASSRCPPTFATVGVQSPFLRTQKAPNMPHICWM